MKRALVISLICVLGLAFSGLAATLSGSWDTDIDIDPQALTIAALIDLDTVLTVIYTIGDWTFTSVTDLAETGWTDQDFSVAGVLGAFTLTSALDFVPVTPAFTSWVTTAAVSIAGVSFTSTFTLDGTGATGDTLLVLGASGVAGDVVVSVSVSFGDANDNDGCDLDWAGVQIGVDFPFDCAMITSDIYFTCAGFDKIIFATTGIAIPNLPWVTLGATLQFTMQTKSLVLAPAFNFGTIVCFDLYFDVDTTGDHLTLGAITIEGIGLVSDFGGVTFTGLSFWGTGTKPGLLAGKEYWEVYQIATTDDGCCGPFSFDVAVYFKTGGLRLFDVAFVDANMSLQVASQFSFDMGFEINVDTGLFSKWEIGFDVDW